MVTANSALMPKTHMCQFKPSLMGDRDFISLDFRIAGCSSPRQEGPR